MSRGAAAGAADERSAPRRGLRGVVAGVVLAESFGLVAAAVFLVVEIFRTTPADTGGAIAQVVVVAVLGAGLLLAWWAVVRADERARVPVVVWQLLQAAVGAPAAASRWYVAVVLVGSAIVAGVGVMVPGVLRPDARGMAAE